MSCGPPESRRSPVASTTFVNVDLTMADAPWPLRVGSFVPAPTLTPEAPAIVTAPVPICSTSTRVMSVCGTVACAG